MKNVLRVISALIVFITSCKNSTHENKLHSQGEIYVDESGNVVNQVDDENLKQGKWMLYRDGDNNSMTNLPSLNYQGYYKDDKKVGYWKEYSKYGEIVDSVLYVEGVQKINSSKTYTVNTN